jgi:hypothetical protein
MAKYIDKNGNITFNTVPTSNFMGLGLLIAHPDLSGASDADLADIAEDNGGRLPSKVNAVEIDWNGASICNQTINTTGQLLKIINDLYNKVNNIEITKKVTNIKLSPTSKTLTAIGSTFTIGATVTPTDATNKVLEWSSSNQSIAIVDDNGKVTAKGHGSTVITCAATDGSGVKATCSVTVNIPTTQPSPTDTPTDTPSETPTDDPTAPIYNSTILYGVRTTDSSTIKFTNYSDFSRVTSDSVPQGSSRTFTISGETLTWPTQRSNYVHIITNQNVEVVKAIVGNVTYSMGIGYRINGYNVFVIANSKAPATIGSGYDITIELYHSKTAITPSGYNGSSSGGSTSGSTTPSPTETPTDTPTNTPSNTTAFYLSGLSFSLALFAA